MDNPQTESRFNTLVTDLRSRIEAQPVRSFYYGIGLGVVITLFARYLVPLALIVALVAGLLWFFSEDSGSPK